MMQPTAITKDLMPTAPALDQAPKAKEGVFSQVMARQEELGAKAEARHSLEQDQPQLRERAPTEDDQRLASRDIQSDKKNVSKLEGDQPPAAPNRDEDPTALGGAVAQPGQGAVIAAGEVAAATQEARAVGAALSQPQAQMLAQVVAPREASAAEPLQHMHLPKLGVPEGVLVSWEAQPAGVNPDTAALEASTWQVWAARLQGQHQGQGQALPLIMADEVAQALPQGQAPLPLAPTGQAPAPVVMGAVAQQGGQSQGQSQSGDGAPQGQGFEVVAAAADVQGGAKAASAAPVSRAGAATQAIRESLQLRAQEGGGHQARLEVQVGEDRLIIQVRVRDGQVDVDVRGMDTAELARLRQELEPELSRQRLALGDLRQDDTTGASAQEQGHGHQGERQEAHHTEGIAASTVPPRQQSGGQVTARAQEPGLHLEA
jgi:hypothetical protein